jgi:hypothetical protein
MCIMETQPDTSMAISPHELLAGAEINGKIRSGAAKELENLRERTLLSA